MTQYRDRSDPLGQSPENRARAEEHERKLAEFQKRVDDFTDGRSAEALAHDDAVWVDHDFRMFILGTVQGMKRLKRDSDDLAVIARVFGGKGRG